MFEFSKISQIKSDLISGLSESVRDKLPRFNFASSILASAAGSIHVLQRHVAWVYKQIPPNTSDEKTIENWGKIYELPRKTATFARVKLRSNTATQNVTIEAGTQFKSRSNGLLYELRSKAVIGLSSPEIIVECIQPGTIGNRPANDAFAATKPIRGLDGQFTAISMALEAVDDEEFELYKARVLQAITQPAEGGTYLDYIRWSKSVSGVSDCFVGLKEFKGVAVPLILKSGGSYVDDPNKILEVNNYIEPLKPWTANAQAMAPSFKNIRISIRVDPFSEEIASLITAELNALQRRLPPAGCITENRFKTPYTLRKSQIIDVISIVFDFKQIQVVQPINDVVLQTCEVINFESITVDKAI